MTKKVAIIGSGPAGHTAAIYLGRAKLNPELYEGVMANGFSAGGQLTTTTIVENYPGFVKGITGIDLTDNLRSQSILNGAKVITKTISKVDFSSKPFKLWYKKGKEEIKEEYESVIIATGSSSRKLNIPGGDEYWQRGISTCAVCDGSAPIFKNKPIAIVGGGDSACEEASYMSKIGSEIYLFLRKNRFKASPIMIEKVKANEKIKIFYNEEIKEIIGDGNLLNSIKVYNNVTRQLRTVPVSGLFYAIGHIPATNLFKNQLELDNDGYIVTKPGSTCTSVKGVFAAGDVQDKVFRQAVVAAGSGCMSAIECGKYLEYESK